MTTRCYKSDVEGSELALLMCIWQPGGSSTHFPKALQICYGYRKQSLQTALVMVKYPHHRGREKLPGMESGKTSSEITSFFLNRSFSVLLSNAS